MRNLTRRSGALALWLALVALVFVQSGIAATGGPPWP
jgi:hypothetical protein